MDFLKFKIAVAKQFKEMGSTGALFVTNADKQVLWETYLASFPVGTDPIFRERTEHDCNCCKGFIRTLGGIVAIKGNKVMTLWDIAVDEPGYQAVADALAALVRSSDVVSTFLHYEKFVGTDRNFEALVKGTPRRWDHFFVNLPTYAVGVKAAIGTTLGEQRSTYDVMLRSLQEITPEATATVLELISQNSLYRGEEHRFAVNEFAKLQKTFTKVSSPSLFVWENFAKPPQSVSRIRSTSIGTLLVDLSNGVELEKAVKSFEAKVAPMNYKRPTALVTQSMIEDARKTVAELGLTSSLERRYATLSDITINNILFADHSTRKAITGSVFDDLAATTPTKVNLDRVEDVSIDKFLMDILPKINSIEVMLENRHTSNLVSLIAPMDPTSGKLFKWDNRFSWSYNGEVADSIKERVKAAGGRTEGDLCCRLAWHNTDDLDFHMLEPDGHTIYFGNRRRESPCGGILDLDANGADGQRPDPAENIVYANRHKMKTGMYVLMVHQFNKRQKANVGFEVEIEFDGQTINMVYDKEVSDYTKMVVANIKYTASTKKFEVEPLLPSTQASKEVWGLNTSQFHRASVIMSSPNFWDDIEVGNRHWFFMLEGAINDGKARGFYNEFLKQDLDKHRKVLELVGSKTTVKDAPHQLSGLGFSSTQRNNLLCRVSGSFTRNINILF